jgi:hypothetical protein
MLDVDVVVDVEVVVDDGMFVVDVRVVVVRCESELVVDVRRLL